MAGICGPATTRFLEQLHPDKRKEKQGANPFPLSRLAFLNAAPDHPER
jgi:hypothetical protein